MIRGAIDAFPELDGTSFLSARQEYLETIHQHDVVAERYGTIDEIRRELATGAPSAVHTSRRAWLDAAP
jgi:GTP cyclohydrolase I/GTP cyclohydrolase-4